MELPHFSTHRLLIQPRTAGDLPDLLRLHQNPSVMRYARFASDQAAWNRKLSRSLERPFPRGLGYWTLRRSDTTQRFVGSVMLIAFPQDSTTLETGWRLETTAWYRGYAQEAMGAILAHGFSLPTVTRIIAFIHEDNVPSVKLASRLGFAATDILSGSHRLYEICALHPAADRGTSLSSAS